MLVYCGTLRTTGHKMSGIQGEIIFIQCRLLIDVFFLGFLGKISTLRNLVIVNKLHRKKLNVIQRHIRPGTSIYSDEFTPYRTLHQLGYIHLAVNHSKNFVDPNTGVHTNTIEGIWSMVKRKFKRMSGTPYQHLPGYLDEFMWRRRHDDHFVAILEDMAAGF